MKPILFLDIDGVLNSEAWYRRRPDMGKWHEANEFDPEAVWLLRAVVAMSGCQIVVSSSWRHGRTLEDFQRLLPGLPLIGFTPALTTGKNRGDEVQKWIEDNAHTGPWCVVDDSTDFYDDQPRVRTDWKIGLTPAAAERLVANLSAPTIHQHGVQQAIGACNHDFGPNPDPDGTRCRNGCGAIYQA
jgi:hypothetical protein